jgi:menaquinone-dependent protoporphyrinogen oxidase
MKILVAYATGHGSTAEVAEFIAEVLKAHDAAEVIVSGVTQVESVDGYDAFVLGSPIYGGMWRSEFSQFLEKFKVQLAAKPVYMWIMCVRILESGGREYSLQEYIHHSAIQALGVREVEVFAGKLILAEIDWNERWTLAARYEGEALPGSRDDDYRDWNTIRSWAVHLRENLLPA